MLSFGLTYYVCIFASLCYPTYASFKALQSALPDDDTQWLTYWVVNAFMTTVESVAEPLINWIPLYYEAKLLVLLWMIAPQTNGAKFLYDNHIKPFLKKYASKLDPIFARTEQALNSKYVGVAANLVEQYGPDVAESALKIAQEQAAKIAAQVQQQAAAAGTKKE